MAGADAVLADMRWPMGAAVALAEARSAGVPGIVDFDTNTATDAGSVLTAASHVVFSSAGLAGLTGTEDIVTGLRRAAEQSDAWLAVTKGAAGVTWLDGDDVRHRPAFAVDAVDTLGAGDVFHGAFALALAEERSVEDAVQWSAAAAAVKCTRFGGRAGIPSRRDVVAFLNERTEGEEGRWS